MAIDFSKWAGFLTWSTTATWSNDFIVGTIFGDNLRGYGGNDVMVGLTGADTLAGDNGDDAILGGAGNDTVTGGAGDDLIVGGLGADMLMGGAGADHFVFSNIVVNTVLPWLNLGQDSGKDIVALGLEVGNVIEIGKNQSVEIVVWDYAGYNLNLIFGGDEADPEGGSTDKIQFSYDKNHDLVIRTGIYMEDCLV